MMNKIGASLTKCGNNICTGNEMVQLASEGRSLVMTDDYSEPSANRGHDPSRNRGGGGGRKG